MAWTFLGCAADEAGRGASGTATAGIATAGETSGMAPDSASDTDGGSMPDEPDDPDASSSSDGGDEVCGNGIDDDGNGTIDEQCTCEPGTSQACFPQGPGDPCPGLQTCKSSAEIAGWSACEVDLEVCEPPEDGTTGEDVDVCETEPRQTTTQVLTFTSPLQTVGACPWNDGDNLGQTSGVMAARREATQALQPPAGAVLCSTRFEVPETAMYYDDFMYVLFNDIVILAPGDWSGFLMSDNGLLVYDWMAIRGQSGDGDTYCPGAGSVCELPDTQQDGSIVLELDEPTQDVLLDRAADQGSYTITVAATGDNDPGVDCDHSTFNLEVTYEYVIP